MTLAGLHFDFFGGAGMDDPDEGISEQSFDITVDEGDKLYRMRGFIDKLFLYEEEGTAIIRDFKSSKQIFKGKELTDNLQDLLYTLAVKKLFPHFKKRQVEFLFLKFDLNSNGRVKDENGKIIKSVFKENKDSLKAKDGQTIEMIEYKGCPYWNKPKVDIDDFF